MPTERSAKDGTMSNLVARQVTTLVWETTSGFKNLAENSGTETPGGAVLSFIIITDIVIISVDNHDLDIDSSKFISFLF